MKSLGSVGDCGDAVAAVGVCAVVVEVDAAAVEDVNDETVAAAVADDAADGYLNSLRQQ